MATVNQPFRGEHAHLLLEQQVLIEQTRQQMMRSFVRRSLESCLVAFLLTVPSSFAQNAYRPQQPRMDMLRSEHVDLLEQLNAKDAKGRLMELDDPRIPPLLMKGWGQAGAYAAQYLEYFPKASTRELERIFAGFAPPPHSSKSRYGNFLEYDSYAFRGTAIRIAPSLYVVEASYGVEFLTSTFMVVGRNKEGHFQELWNIKDLAAEHYAQRDEIGRWLYLVGRAYYNGPLAVQEVLALTPAANGHPRFLVDAYQGADGGTILAQLSVWEWDGAAAKPLLVELYRYASDFRGFHFDGKTLQIITKEETQTFFGCGMCPQPRGIWTLKITPTGVDNLGHRFLQPEVQWADELLSKLNKGDDTTGIADPKVAGILKARIDEAKTERAPANKSSSSKKREFSWGMLGECHVLRRGQRGSFVLDLDEGQLHLSYVLRNGRPYFTSVRVD
jgi:hypothetical protein